VAELRSAWENFVLHVVQRSVEEDVDGDGDGFEGGSPNDGRWGRSHRPGGVTAGDSY